jgi:hypothetical protein
VFLIEPSDSVDEGTSLQTEGYRTARRTSLRRQMFGWWLVFVRSYLQPRVGPVPIRCILRQTTHVSISDKSGPLNDTPDGTTPNAQVTNICIPAERSVFQGQQTLVLS